MISISAGESGLQARPKEVLFPIFSGAEECSCVICGRCDWRTVRVSQRLVKVNPQLDVAKKLNL
jgi:hypothetical protein